MNKDDFLIFRDPNLFYTWTLQKKVESGFAPVLRFHSEAEAQKALDTILHWHNFRRITWTPKDRWLLFRWWEKVMALVLSPGK